MGLRLNVDLETSAGPSQEVYARVESISYNKFTAAVMFQITYWVDQNHAIKATKTFLDEEQRNMVGLIYDRVMYYPIGNAEEVEIFLPQYMDVSAVNEEEVDIPIYETKLTKREVPYVSFDENGEEVTLYRTVTEEKQVQVGVKKEVKKVIDYGVSNRLAEFTYEVLKGELAKWFPKDNIETVK